MSSSIRRHDLNVRWRWASAATAMLTLPTLLVGTIGSPPVLADRAVRAGGSWEVLSAARSLPTFSQPTDLALDARGTIYVVDSGNRRVVRLSSRGQVVGQLGQGSASGSGKSIIPTSVTLDRQGNLYVGDTDHHQVARFSPDGRRVSQWDLTEKGATVDQMVVRAGPMGKVVIVMVARVASGSEYLVVQRRSPTGALLNLWRSNGPPSGVSFYGLSAALDSEGNLYLTYDEESNDCGNGCNWFPAFAFVFSPDGRQLRSFEVSPFPGPVGGVAVGARGNIFVSGGRSLLKLSSVGRKLAEWFPFGVRGPVVGFGALALNRVGNIYASDAIGNRIAKVSPSGRLLAQWGAGGSGPGQFLSPSGLAIDPRGQLWVMDLGNQRVKHLSPDGRTLGQWPAHSGTGALAVDSQGNVYIDNGTGIDKYSPRGRLLARINAAVANHPIRLAVGTGGDIFLFRPELFWQVVKLTPAGRLLARLGPRICVARGLALDRQGNIYESEEFCGGKTGGRVLKLSPTGTVLGDWGGTAGGRVRFSKPCGVAVDRTGAIYVADSSRDRIVKLSPSGAPLATWGSSGSRPGQFHLASVQVEDNNISDCSIAVDAQDRVFVADTGNNRIQRLVP